MKQFKIWIQKFSPYEFKDNDIIKLKVIKKYNLNVIKDRQNKYKPIATNKNLKARAENGSLLSIIGLVVINADDHNKTKINGKILIIKAL